MTTRTYAAKKVLFDRLGALTVVGGPLEGVQVAYAYPGPMAKRCIYGGGIRFDHTEMVAEGVGLAVLEESRIRIYIRLAQSPATSVEETDAAAAALGAIVAGQLRANPDLGSGITVLGIASGQGDYDALPEQTTSILSYELRVRSNLSYA